MQTPPGPTTATAAREHARPAIPSSPTGAGNTVTVSSPGAQQSTVGTRVRLQIHATDSEAGQKLTYDAEGLPAGPSINHTTGLITGTPADAETDTVTVTATDSTGATGSNSFTWATIYCTRTLCHR